MWRFLHFSQTYVIIPVCPYRFATKLFFDKNNRFEWFKIQLLLNQIQNFKTIDQSVTVKSYAQMKSIEQTHPHDNFGVYWLCTLEYHIYIFSLRHELW